MRKPSRPWQLLIHLDVQQLCWKGVLTYRSQSDSCITVEIFWSCPNILITWQVPRQQTAPWCSNADTSQNPTAYWGEKKKNHLIPALKTRIQLQPVLSPTVLLSCPLPMSVSLQTRSCNAVNVLFTKWLRSDFSRSSPCPTAASTEQKTKRGEGRSLQSKRL